MFVFILVWGWVIIFFGLCLMLMRFKAFLTFVVTASASVALVRSDVVTASASVALVRSDVVTALASVALVRSYKKMPLFNGFVFIGGLKPRQPVLTVVSFIYPSTTAISAAVKP
jgi:hypothetical protein